MAKSVKFPLKLADGTAARSLEELRDHGDVESVIKHYKNGTLARWLKVWKYEEQAQQVAQHNNQQIASSKANLQEVFSLLEIPLDEAQFDQYCQNNMKGDFVFSDMEDSGLGSAAMGEGVSIKEKLLPFFPTLGNVAERVKQELEHWEVTETELDGGVVQINYASQKYNYYCSQQLEQGDDLYNEVAFALEHQISLFLGIPISYETKYSMDESVSSEKKYAIGDTGPGGGIVFCIDGDKAYEVSESFGSYTWDQAKKVAEKYRGGGFSDWRLPTRDELNMLQILVKVEKFDSQDSDRLEQKNGFLRSFSFSRQPQYWSSTQYSGGTSHYACAISFNSSGTCHESFGNDYAHYSVRAVRSFPLPS